MSTLFTGWVKAKTPFVSRPVKGWDSRTVPDLEELANVIAEIEGHRKSIPVLLKEYLRLGGKLLGFNVGPQFNDSLDGLIVVDLARTERRLLSRYMSELGLAAFLDYQNAPAVVGLSPLTASGRAVVPLARLEAFEQLPKIGEVVYRFADRLGTARRTVADDDEVVFLVMGELQRVRGFLRPHHRSITVVIETALKLIIVRIFWEQVVDLFLDLLRQALAFLLLGLFALLLLQAPRIQGQLFECLQSISPFSIARRGTGSVIQGFDAPPNHLPAIIKSRPSQQDRKEPSCETLVPLQPCLCGLNLLLISRSLFKIVKAKIRNCKISV
jgi:hypothetical protein